MSLTQLWLAQSPVTRADVSAFALKHGLNLAGDPPWTGGVRQSTWSGEDAQLTYAAHAPSGKGLFVVASPDPSLAAALQARFALQSPEEVMAAAEAAEGRVATIEAIYAVGALLLATHREPDDEVAFLCARLSHDDRHVRFAAARILRGWPRADVVAAMAEAATSHPDLARLHDHLQHQLEALEAGVLNDHPTDDWETLVLRARAGLADGKPARIERATDMLLEQRLDHPEGLVLRAQFHALSGDAALALGFLGAAREAIAREADVRQEGDTDDLVELSAEVQGLAQRCAEMPPGSTEAALPWLARFYADDRGAVLYGMANALLDLMPSHRPLLCLLAGEFDADCERLAEAIRLVPDSPAAHLALARALPDTEAADVEQHLRRALLLIDEERRSAAAAAIEEFLDPVTPGEVLEVLTPMVYKQQRYEEAGTLADALVEHHAESTAGWQIRANARTFAGQHAEAARLYQETLDALDAIVDGDGIMIGKDPRPMMRFNRACVLAKIGERETSLDELRRAVRAEAVWAERAVEDDYFGELLEDETFKRIVAREPRALVAASELEQGAVASLLERALGLSHGGDVEGALEAAETATERAAWGGHTDLGLRAQVLRGRVVALERDPGAGLEIVARAVAQLREQTAPEARIEVVHTHGLVLQVNGRLDEAEAAYRDALAARRAHQGEQHPLLAKSLGDLANLASMRGDDAQSEALRRQAVGLLEAHLDAVPSDDDERAESLTDLATIRANLAHLALRAERWAEALAEATAAAEAVERLNEMGYRHGSAFMDNLAGLLGDIVRLAPDETSARAATTVHMRVEGMGLDSRPAVREEQVFWRRLRRFVAGMRREGASDAVLSETFANALRGPENLPEALRAVPELAGFAHALAQRAAAVPTFLVLAPMALETARIDGRLDQALEQLEGLCVSYAIEGAAG